MKTILLSASLALALSASVWAADPSPAPSAVDLLSRDVKELDARLRDATEEIAALQKRLDEIEARLGESYGGVSPFNTIERRLEELEKDVDDLKR